MQNNKIEPFTTRFDAPKSIKSKFKMFENTTNEDLEKRLFLFSRMPNRTQASQAILMELIFRKCCNELRTNI